MQQYTIVAEDGMKYHAVIYDDGGPLCLAVGPEELDQVLSVFKTVDTESKEESFAIKLPDGILEKHMSTWATAVAVAAAMMNLKNQEEGDGRTEQGESG